MKLRSPTLVVVCFPLLTCSSSKSSSSVDAHGDGASLDAATSDAIAAATSSPDVSSAVDFASSDTTVVGVPWNAATQAIPTTPFLVIDQFGYRTGAEKIAVVRTPVTGFDATTTFAPSASLSVVDVHSGTTVWSGAPVAWNAGATDSDTNHGSGDKTWWLTFSALTTPGTYVVVDTGNNVRSYPFQISDTVYANIFGSPNHVVGEDRAS
jgi:hypothetical protein